jgi:hypothetical protein
MSLIEWHPISERILREHFKGNVQNVTVIQCYDPTDGWNANCQKTAFYLQSSGVVLDSNKRDIKIVMGDLNAKDRAKNELLDHVMGNHGINGNGEMFAGFCAHQEVTIGGTLFIQKEILKNAWASPNFNTENQINSIAVSQSVPSTERSRNEETRF